MEEISKVAVEALVNKVRSAMKEDAEQWQTVRCDLVFIVDEFEMMQSFLGSADREAVKTNMARTWVRQVRDLSHDLEDCIEFIRHLDTDKSSWWLRLRPSCSCGRNEEVALPVDVAVDKIKQLKARVEEVSQRNMRYRFVVSDDSAGSKFPTPPQPQEVVPGTGTGTRGGLDILVEARDTAARYRSVGDLTKLVMGKSNDIQVISVWGTGNDLGTMAIIRSMYDEPGVQEHFRSRAWVKVMHPINIPELIRSLVVQFYANSCQDEQDDATAGSVDTLWRLYRRLKKGRDALSWTETSAGELVKELVRKINNTQPYLIVLEDLSAMDQWDAIRPYLMRVRGENKGSRIVVSTRHHELASLCTGKPYRVSELQRLSASQSTCVFFNTGATNETGIVTTEEIDELWKNRLLVGRNAEFKKLFNLIKCGRPHNDNDKPHVVCVWGLPGSGRTAVVTNVYYHYYKMECFEYTRMLRMSQPYNLMGFCRCLLYNIPPRLLEGKTPIERCRNLLHKYRCLVIYEVKSREEWKLIEDAQLISAKSKSCIVIVTTEESVAVHCAGAEDLVCSIKCLQQNAAFDLFKQAYSDEYEKIRNKSKKEAIQDKGSANYFEQTLDYIFEAGTQAEQAFQNSSNSFVGETFQNNGNSFQGETFQNNGNLIDGGQASQNSGNLMEEQTFQNNGNLIDGEAFQNSEEQVLHNNGTSFGKLAFQNNGNSFPAQAFENSSIHIQLLEGESSQNNGNSLPGQAFQNSSMHLFKGESSQNNGNSLPGQAFQNSSILKGESSQNNGNLFGKTLCHEEFELLFEVNRQEEYGFQYNGSLYAEHACENSEEHAFRNSEIYDKLAFENNGKSFEEVAYENNEKSFEELSVQHNGNLIEELGNQENGIVMEEHEKEDPLKGQTSQDNQESMFCEDPNVKSILWKSGGFPPVIVALGRYLARQHLPNIGAMEWHRQRLITNFMEELQTNPHFYCLGGLLAWMRTHFSSCPPSVMRCMLYLQIFPQGRTFGQKRLVRRWIAEGYTKNTESNNSLSDEEYAGELFHKLASQSVVVNVIQQEARYEVNGFFREYMISRPMEDNVLSPLEVSVLDGRHCRVSTQTQGVGQHLSVHDDWERKNRVVFESLDLSRLRSFTVFGPWERFFVSDKMEVLRVLDLEDSTGVGNEDVDRIGKVLLRLKLLSLRGCKGVTSLPDSLGGLSQLQTLDIRGTSVQILGQCITKLQKLKYVRASCQLDKDTSTVEGALQPQPPTETSSAIATPAPAAPAPVPVPASSSSTSRPTGATLLMSRLRWRHLLHRGSRNGGVRMHGGIGKMTALHTLGVIDVSGVARGRSVLVELGKLSQLRKLGLSGVNRENVHEFCSAIARHSAHLESLSVWFDKNMNRPGCLDGISPAPVKLESLKLYGHQDNKLPSWMKRQPERSLLSKLDLRMTSIPQDEIDQELANLPKLRILFLSLEEFPDDGLQFRRGFKALQLLEIALNCRLKALTFQSGEMNNLEVLRLRCREDVHVPPSLRFSEKNRMDNLQEVKLTGSRYCHDAMKQLLEKELHVHPRLTRPVVTAD